VRGALLFLIYVHDIGNARSDAKVKLFADDTNLFVYSARTDLLYQTAQNCIAQLYQSFIVNRLTLNLSKACYLIFPKAQNQDEVAIVVDNVKLKNVNECKYLGVILDYYLKWTAHIEKANKTHWIILQDSE
jgi:hypothetical protein